MLSLFIRNAIFTVLQPGLVAGLIPYLILGDEWKELLAGPFEWYQYAAFLLFGVGLVIMLYCIYMFAREGKGTLSPVDRTKKLVVQGLYKYSRNPMYVGVILILISEALFTSSMILWLYTVAFFLVFHLFILFIEEPRLKRDFGKAYEEYCGRVGRWV